MDKPRFGLYVRLVLALGCVVMSALSFAGVFSGGVANGRLIFGGMWLLIGGGWLFRCYYGWKKLNGDNGAGDER
jgi:hypothetical protein